MRKERSIEDEIDGLYGLSLGEFVSVRNDLAKRLRQEGEREAAARIKVLIKPTVSAWVVNQLHRQAGELLSALLDAADEIRGTLKSGQGAAEHQVVMRRRGEVLAELLEKATELLEEDGHSPSAGQLQRVGRTLEALAAYGRGGEVKPGRLIADLEPPGFDALAGFPLAPSTSPAPAPRQPESGAPGKGRTGRKLKAPPDGGSEAQADLQKALEQVAVLKRQAEEAARERQGAMEAEAAAVTEAAEAKRRAEAAQQAAHEAGRRTEAARKRAEEADQALVKGEQEVKRFRQTLKSAPVGNKKTKS